MFKRRKTEGFEWREYVRTTILVRRKERRQRVEDVKVAAVEGLKDVGRKGMEASAKGAASASRTFSDLLAEAGQGLAAAARGAGPALKAAVHGAGQMAEDAHHRLRDLIVPLLGSPLAVLRTPALLLALKTAALALAILAGIRALQFGVDWDATIAFCLAASAAGLYVLARVSDPDPASEVPSVSQKLGALLGSIPGLQGFSDRARGGALLGVIGFCFAGAIAWQHAPALPFISGSASLSTSSIDKAASTALEGRATALTGSTLKVSGETLVLDGIEAPEMEQICRRPGGSWRCGEAAKQELADRLRGKRTLCERVGTTTDGVVRARCEAGGEDVAKVLVAKGVVFADASLFASYASAETAAKEKRLGLWSGNNERPADYRAKLWEEAKKLAPDGCPVKGRVRSGNRIYILPWSASYDTVRINTAKGERWFCTEDEAVAAGWRKAENF